VSLTTGTGPFGARPGQFNADLQAPDHLLYFEDSPRRVRVVFAGETIADSRRMKLLHETGHVPVYYFPITDVRAELLQPGRLRTNCPVKGDAAHWSIVVGDRAAPDAAWEYPSPVPQASWLAGYLAFYWEKVDAWYEEDEQVHVHARDPYHRVDVLDSDRPVRISLAGQLLAETKGPKVLFETGLPRRYYLPAEDVRTELLEPSDTVTRSPYLGTAQHWSARVAGGVVPNLVWSYQQPLRDGEPVRGMFCFYSERVDLELDGSSP
jgi:uncharacterized protein (DUF427 family)